jgi:hypothetical protein
MSDMQEARPGGPGTTEGESGPSESDPVSPSAAEPGGDEDESQTVQSRRNICSMLALRRRTVHTSVP